MPKSRDSSPKRSERPILLIYFSGETWDDNRHVVVTNYTPQELEMIEKWPASDNILRDVAGFSEAEDSEDEEVAEAIENRKLFDRLYELPDQRKTTTIAGPVRFFYISIFN